MEIDLAVLEDVVPYISEVHPASNSRQQDARQSSPAPATASTSLTSKTPILAIKALGTSLISMTHQASKIQAFTGSTLVKWHKSKAVTASIEP